MAFACVTWSICHMIYLSYDSCVETHVCHGLCVTWSMCHMIYVSYKLCVIWLLSWDSCVPWLMYCSVLQCVAVYRRVLQCAAVCCNVLRLKCDMTHFKSHTRGMTLCDTWLVLSRRCCWRWSCGWIWCAASLLRRVCPSSASKLQHACSKSTIIILLPGKHIFRFT